jgi:hypothetical protein
MDIKVRVTGGGDGELAALGAWLSDEDELRGRVKIVRGPIGDTELGSLPELLTVALGAGGAGTALATSLRTWLSTRRTSAKITVQAGERSISLDIQTVGDVAPLLERILKAADGD